MKPLLILAPSSSHWPALEGLLEHEDDALLKDLKTRLTDGASEAQDAFAVVPDGSRMLAGAVIRRHGAVGVLGPMFTRDELRRRGLARGLLQTLLSWFDMTGGKWLYVTCPHDFRSEMLEHFGFMILRRHPDGDKSRVSMLRRPSHTAESPFDNLEPRSSIREARRGDWPLLVALLQHHRGADPRVGLDESALGAERAALDWLIQAESGACQLIVSVCAGRIVGLGSLATGQPGRRSYAMIVPHDQPPQGLRQAVLDRAAAGGYEQVDFPMESL